MDEPHVTFIMPLKYYREDFLRYALQSLQRQTCPRWNLLVVVEPADHSTFAEVLSEDLRDPRIELTIMSGRPFTGSINTGMRRARTEFVALLFADDLLADETVDVLSAAIRDHPEVDFFYSSRQAIDELGGRVGPVRTSPPRFAIADFKWASPVKHLMCWRREEGLAVGGIDESLIKGPDDNDFPWSMAEHGAVFRAVPECLYFMRDHCSYYRRTTHIPRSTARRGLRKILKKHGVGFFARHFIVMKRFRDSLGKQAIYRNPVDRWLKERLRVDARRFWRGPARPAGRARRSL
jgi:glycosyltransferase involved in cell wall biosynthesis